MASADEQRDMLRNRLRKTAQRRRRWARRRGITCYRVYDRDIPEIPLSVDWYDGRLHVAEYERPGSPEGDAHHEWLAGLLSAAGEALEVAPADTFVKRRERQRGRAQYERFGSAAARFEVSEDGHSFWVNLSDYLDTGLFLDHRDTRARVGAESEGRRVLNLYAYTAAFSVYAAAGGARTTTSVDMSRTYCQWAGENLTANGFGPPEHRVVQADVRRFLTEHAGRRWDLVVVDPPTFSNSKRMAGVFDVQRDHPRLLDAVVGVCAPAAVVYFSCNLRRFRLQWEHPQAVVEDISAATIPEDFRNQRVHRAYRIGVAS